VVQRIRPVTQWRRAAPAAVALARQVGPSLTNPELAAALNAAGHTTGTGKPFDTTGAGNLRYAYKIDSPDLLVAGEPTVRGVAERLEISMSTVHAWLGAGTLPARRRPTGRWCIPFDADAEAACRDRLATSAHVHRDRDDIEGDALSRRDPGPAPGSSSGVSVLNLRTVDVRDWCADPRVLRELVRSMADISLTANRLTTGVRSRRRRSGFPRRIGDARRSLIRRKARLWRCGRAQRPVKVQRRRSACSHG
jgi:hypothetical protein